MAAGLTDRKHPLAECEKCPLQSKPCAKTQGPKDAKIAVVSRSPGFHEAMAGKPFSGPSGKVLDYFLNSNGVMRDDILVTNVVLCSPPAGKVPKEAIAACRSRLQSELDSCDLIIAAGSEAVGEILGRGSIDSFRGYTHDRTNNGKTQKVVVTNNPALVLRDDSTFPNLRKDFQLALNPKEPRPFTEVEVIKNEREAKAVIRDTLRRTGIYIAGDIEGRGGLTHKADIVTFQWSTDGSRAFVMGEREFGSGDKIADLWKEGLESSDYKWIWHNGKYDVKILRYGYGINARVDEDTMLLSHALDERPGVHALEYLLMDEYGWPNYEPKSVKDFKKDGIVRDYDELYTYAGRDAGGTRWLYDDLRDRAIDDSVFELYHERIYIPFNDVAINMELNGARYDWNRAADMYEREVEPELNSLIVDMRKIIDNPILNPRSPKQVSALFYDDWGIKHGQQSRPDKERSVDDKARQEILDGQYTTKNERTAKKAEEEQFADTEKEAIIEPFVGKLHRYASLNKQAGTYIISLSCLAAEDPESKVYTEIKLIGTESGRTSSAGPNLQNITRTKEGLPNIRDLFYAPEGRKIINVDLSQAELRTIAKLSGDTELLGIYRDTNRSLHREVAEQFYGKDYTYEQYVQAKNINFGVAYLQGAFSFAQMYGMDQREAQNFINIWWKRFPQVKAWTEATKKEVHNPSTIVSPFGRKRRFYLITDENRDHAYKEAINFKAQSTASDLTLTGTIRLHQLMDHNRASLLFTVHDSIVAEVDDDYVEEFSRLAVKCLEEAPVEALGWSRADIPYIAEVSFGQTWGTVEELELAA